MQRLVQTALMQRDVAVASALMPAFSTMCKAHWDGRKNDINVSRRCICRDFCVVYKSTPIVLQGWLELGRRCSNKIVLDILAEVSAPKSIRHRLTTMVRPTLCRNTGRSHLAYFSLCSHSILC